MIGQPWTDILSAALITCNIRLAHRWITSMQVRCVVLQYSALQQRRLCMYTAVVLTFESLGPHV